MQCSAKYCKYPAEPDRRKCERCLAYDRKARLKYNRKNRTSFLHQQRCQECMVFFGSYGAEPATYCWPCQRKRGALAHKIERIARNDYKVFCPPKLAMDILDDMGVSDYTTRLTVLNLLWPHPDDYWSWCDASESEKVADFRTACISAGAGLADSTGTAGKVAAWARPGAV